MSADVIIRKQKIRIQTSSESLAFECRRFVVEKLNDDLIRMYERVFYQQTHSDDHVIINCLRIDLGMLSPGELRNDNIIQLIEHRLISELQKQFEDNPQADMSTKGSTAEASPIQFATEKQQCRSALLYFLESGSYPWWYKKDQRKKPSELLAGLDRSEQESFFLEIINLTKKLSRQEVEHLVKRLMDHLEPSVCESYVHQITDLYSDNLIHQNVRTLLDQKEQFIRLFNLSLKTFYGQVLDSILLDPTEKHYLKRFIKRLIIVSPVPIKELKSRSKLEVDEYLFDLMKDEFVDDESSDIKFKSSASGSSESRRKGNITKLNEEGFYIENAGIILLHPFLPAFFKGQRLVNTEDQFVSEDARLKAAVLLYYLQCSDAEYKEWEMALLKVLCGIAIDDVIPDGIPPSAEEKGECEQLLHAVVDYWDALKGSSVEALQNTFLLRNGKLSHKDDYWLLQIERTGVDILLERLPWGIGTIKLPWLRELIHVEW